MSRLKADSFLIILAAILVLLSFSSSPLLAQTPKVDSLRSVLALSKADNRQGILQSLVNEFIKVNLDSTEFYLKLLKTSIDQKQDSLSLGSYLVSMGTYYDRKGNFDSAGFYLSQGYKQILKTGDRKGISMAANALASMYFNLKNHPKTLDYLREALRYVDTTNYKQIVTLNNNMATVFNFDQQNDSALFYFNIALNLAKSKGLKSELAGVYASLLTYYYHQDDYPKAIEFGELAIPLLKSEKMLFKLGFAYNTLATCYMYSRKFQKSENLYLEGLQHSQMRGERQTVAFYYRNISELYEQMGRYKEALAYSQRYIDLKDSVYSEDLNSKISEIESELSLERKNRELENAFKTNELKQAQLDKEISTRNALIAIVLLVTVLVAILIYNNLLRRKANRLLAKEKEWEHDRLLALESKHLQLQKDHLQAQFETLRSQVDPHFLFNSLNALNALIKTDPDKAIQFSQRFSSLFRKVLELKDQHLITLSDEIDLVNNYLFLQKIRYGENLKVNNELDHLTKKLYIPPFSLQLLVENAIKHNEISEESPLHIRLYTENKKIIVVNSLKKRNLVKDSTGTGLKNLQGRYQFFSETSPLFYEKENQYFAELPVIQEEEESN